MMPPRNKAKNYCWYWVWIVFVVWVAMSVSSGDIITGIILLLLGGILTIIGQVLIKKLDRWFSPQEELCDLLFINTDKIGNKFYRRALNIAPSKNLQNIPIFLRDNNIKTIYSLTISFGVNKSYFQKSKKILVNRLRKKRLITAFSPDSWSDFRTPVLETKPHQPKVKRLIGVCFTGGKTASQPIIVDQSFFYNDEYHIGFEEAVNIPLGHPRGRTIQINLELEMGNDWKGMIKLSSNVDGTNLFVIRKVNVSHKYEVSK